MKLLQVSIDDGVMMALKIQAAKADTNVSEIVREIIADYMTEWTQAAEGQGKQ